MNNTKIKRLAIPLEEFNQDVTHEEREIINAEKKYYQIVKMLREQRNELGFTQEKLAQLSKVPRTTINKVESGSRNATLQTLMAMAQSMGKTIELKLA
ncbi:MAG: helix-turn-helix transcriptional regulator [bacterium]